jgi:transposase
MDDTGGNSGCFDSSDAVVIGRVDMVTGPTGRRRWPDEVKGRLVAESYKTRLSVSEFARRHGVIPSQLFGWRRDAKAGKFAVPVDEGDELFAPLMLEAPSSAARTERPAPPSGRGAELIELEAAGVVIRLPIDTPAARIAEIVRALA